MSLQQTIRTMIKDAAMKTGIYNTLFFDLYPYMFTPTQLAKLTELLGEASATNGCFVEAGCAYGATTVYLHRYMKERGIERRYYAIDTFSGFVADHVAYEVTSRGKPESINDHFRENKKAWFETSVARDGNAEVTAIQSDVTRFDFSALAPIAFCLIDVDLYQPIRAILPQIYAALAPGGIIAVDDCQPHEKWDGALQAYDEFVQERGLPREIVAGKLGILRTLPMAR